MLGKYSVMSVFFVIERKVVVVVPCFEFVFRHASVGSRVTGSCCDSSFVDNVAG